MPDIIESVSGATCLTCQYQNNMPYECLREHWNDRDIQWLEASA